MNEHGGDTVAYEMEYGKTPLDFSANVSPFGLPEGVKEAAERALDGASLYPDPLCRKLTQRISLELGVSTEQILCGNGASDLIWRLSYALRPGHALLAAPGFSEYEHALRQVGCEISYLPLVEENGFRVTREAVDLIGDKTELVFLCQPNNPTGVLIPQEVLHAFMRQCDACGALLVVDECFVEFLREPERHSVLSQLENHDLLILRAFTKSFGMAGLRLGYCLCRDRELLERMRSAGPPWSVSSVAQAAGIAALDEKTYAQKRNAQIVKERQYLKEELKRCGMNVIPGEANFLLFRGPLRLGEQLKEKGILIRDCSNFNGLSKGWYRIAVRTGAENRILIAAIREVIG